MILKTIQVVQVSQWPLKQCLDRSTEENGIFSKLEPRSEPFPARLNTDQNLEFDKVGRLVGAQDSSTGGMLDVQLDQAD